jgi:AbrB family looped-hinge helix DNA binding protein
MDMINTVTSKGTTTIPKAIRDKLGIAPGDQVQFIEKGDDIFIKKSMTLADIRSMSAKYICGKNIAPPTNQEIKEGMADQAAERYKKAMMKTDCSLDTNAVLSLCLEDRQEQTIIIEKLLKNNKCYIDATVFIEMEFVLRKMYATERHFVATFYRLLFAQDTIQCDRKSLVEATKLYESLPAVSFLDSYLSVRAKYQNIPLYTFDKKLARQLEDAEVPC